MGMKHIFVSHAAEDEAIAVRLAENFRNAGHDTKVDTLNLSLGDNSIAFMNDSIANAHTVVILYSRHSQQARLQRLEMDSAVWNEIKQEGGRCIVVRLDDTDIPPILGPKVYGRLDPNNPISLQSLIEEVCKIVLPTQTATAVVARAFGSESRNPFRHLRAEYFEDRPDLLADAFAPPEAFKAGALEDMKPSLLEGSRGTGKSMLLLSLRARNYLLRHKQSTRRFRIFGFYLKLSRGAICNTGAVANVDSSLLEVPQRDAIQIADIAAQEIVIQLLESLFSEIAYCIFQRFIDCDSAAERTLASRADSYLFDTASGPAASLDELLEKLADAHRRVADFVRRRFIYDEHPAVPAATFDLELLKRVLTLVRRCIPSLKDTMFVALLDEYENLFPYQQRIVNGFVKFGPPHVSVKVAKKLGIGDNSGTTSGQELQEIHDYTRITLVYDVEDSDQRSAYYDLLRRIVRKMLSGEHFDSVGVEELLPTDTSPEVPDAEFGAELIKLCKVSQPEFDGWAQERRLERRTYYGEAVTYRVLLGKKGRHADKRYSGFEQLAFLSSGVIRYFQEILGVAYHLEFGTGTPKADAFVLPPAVQSKAVHLVSQHNLTALSRNVEQDGETLKYFLMDLGDCLRQKLLKHGSEPEAARLTIKDPETLTEKTMAPLKRLLEVGEREGVFQTKEGLPAFKPKHASDPQPSEFNICRIYAPVLQISPRLRWRTLVTCNSLVDLLLPGKRALAVRHLQEAMSKPDSATQQGRFDLNGQMNP